MAKSVARIYDVFADLIESLRDQAEKQSAAALRPWNQPKGAGDPLDVPGLAAGLARDEPNAAYAATTAGEDGTIGDVVSIKLQVDYVGIYERAFRARHASPVRLAAMARARRAGHGHAGGVFAGGVMRFAQDALQAAVED